MVNRVMVIGTLEGDVVYEMVYSPEKPESQVGIGI